MSGITSGRLRRFYYPGDSAKPMVPVEWSVASHRLHPMIRNAYAMELTTNGKQSFPNNRPTACPRARTWRPEWATR
ncbi:MAG TPA: hypothetical protein VK586_22360 [Streptosporangiaceae bacterium]|nr:hypothetical protein [Streptosporangiaceae bacterium]